MIPSCLNIDKQGLPHIQSVSHVCRQYNTGEQPILVSCSDGYNYICKYSHSTGSANKLVCELIGVTLAAAFGLNVPLPAIVSVSKEHLQGLNLRSVSNKICIGGRFIDNVVDITPISLFAIEGKEKLIDQLVLIALFDIWTANEDWNSNNYNLMYDIETANFIPIDFGCIFNTSTFEYPLSPLTCTDSILHSELFDFLSTTSFLSNIDSFIDLFKAKISYCEQIAKEILSEIPTEWNPCYNVVKQKLDELFSSKWVECSVSNFKEIINDATHLK